jgi:hypothetical protein
VPAIGELAHALEVVGQKAPVRGRRRLRRGHHTLERARCG